MRSPDGVDMGGWGGLKYCCSSVSQTCTVGFLGFFFNLAAAAAIRPQENKRALRLSFFFFTTHLICKYEPCHGCLNTGDK